MNYRLKCLMLALVLLVVSLAACSSATPTPRPTPRGAGSVVELAVTPVVGTPVGRAGLQVDIEIKEKALDPDRFDAIPDQMITLTVKNTTATKHTIVMPDANVKIEVEPGKTASQNFLAPAVGDYPYYCDEPGHRQAGETGYMTVDHSVE